MNVMSRGLLLLAAATALVTPLAASPAMADTPYYKYVAQHSGMCLDVQDASRAHGAYVLQANCWGGDNQLWRMQSVRGPKWRGTGFPFELIAKHSGMCLDVQDASRAHGAHVLQATCWGGPNQIWRMRTPTR
ncbi:RICIN domain-containing protein [Sphaerisporangium fuscum]|uniref:RICIN domain-containing protein n=1 Tax=Sphaerisporangium fuscum TaxID=2835868 RepID=UPI001BDD6B09|nr:RICIN domain-containing protein [Sphaerisporangium fuscum]